MKIDVTVMVAERSCSRGTTNEQLCDVPSMPSDSLPSPRDHTGSCDERRTTKDTTIDANDANDATPRRCNATTRYAHGNCRFVMLAICLENVSQSIRNICDNVRTTGRRSACDMIGRCKSARSTARSARRRAPSDSTPVCVLVIVDRTTRRRTKRQPRPNSTYLS
jgi:hypothetical protein